MTSEMRLKEKSIELKKHVGAIHSSGSLGLLQRKIANSLLFNAYDDLMIKDEYTISIKTLCTLIGYDSNDYKTVKAALMKLLSTVLEWNLVDRDADDGSEIWNASSIIADASIKGAVCTYSYSKRMKELLYMPEMYGRINMSVQAKFQSSYGLALYENCIRYKNLNFTPWMEWSLFRKLMGVDEKKYIIFRDFKKRVLDKATQEVNQLSDIDVEPELVKESGKVVSIRFKLKKKKSQEGLLLPENTQDCVSQVVNELKTGFAISVEGAKAIIMQYGLERVNEKIKYIKSKSSFKNKNVKNFHGYLIDALQYDFGPIAKQEILNEHKEESDKKQKSMTIEDILSDFNKLDFDKKKVISDAFSHSISDQKQREYFLKHGVCNSLVAADFARFILNFRV